MPAGAEAEIKSLRDLRALTIEDAARRLPVALEGQILSFSADGDSLYLYKDGLGCEVLLGQGANTGMPFSPGQNVFVRGITGSDTFLPHISALTLRIQSESPLPQPIPLTPDNLFTPELDCAWVEISGQIQKLRQKERRIILPVLNDGYELDLHLPNTHANREIALSLQGQNTHVTGVLCTNSGLTRDLEGRYLTLASTQFLELHQSQIAKRAPLQPLPSLKGIAPLTNSLIRTRGVLTYSDRSRLILQSEGRGLLVRTLEPCQHPLGSLLEVSGILSLEPFTNSLKAQSVTFLEQSTLPAPLSFEPTTNLSQEVLDNVLVSLPAEIIERRFALTGSVLTCSAEGTLFQIGLPVSWADLKGLPIGARIQITGVYQRSSSSMPLNPTDPDGFHLLVQNDGQIEILDSGPILARGLAIRILVGTGVLSAAALLWIWLLRRKVAQQTRIISDTVARESSNRERERVARELHDSLEQNLTAVAFQIDNVIRFYKNQKYEPLGPALEVTKKMAKACQRESREAIYDLRGSDESAAWRDEMLLSEAERLGAEIKLKIQGMSYSINKDKQRQIRRIVREATYNGLRHGEATEIRVEYHYLPDSFTTIVRDNGKGFDTKGPRPEGHFGLAGMEERAGRIGAKFILDSTLGSGTTVTIQLPVNRKKTTNISHDQSLTD